MKIPQFWAKHEEEARAPGGRSIDVCCWRWSDRSMEDAREKARWACNEVAGRILSGQPFPDRYAYGIAHPLREETIREIRGEKADPAALVTRNSYGSLVLNTAQVMFVDIDLPEEGSSGGFGGLLGKLFGKPAAPRQSPALDAALERVDLWVRRNSDWGFRVYRTFAGLRLLATNTLCEPDSSDTISVLEQLGCDPLYVKLCKAQKCFRARMTAKPWRLGLNTPPARWPFDGTRQIEAFRKWEERYSAACQRTATCDFLKTVGNSRVHSGADRIVRIHDDMTRSDSKLPLA